jgi:hypothetical protein
MDTEAGQPAPTDARNIATTTGIASIADDRIEGWAKIVAEVCGQHTTIREGRQRLTNGGYPIWREGRRVVASRSALLAHWRQKAQTAAKPGQPAAPQIKSTRRGYRPR